VKIDKDIVAFLICIVIVGAVIFLLAGGFE